MQARLGVVPCGSCGALVAFVARFGCLGCFGSLGGCVSFGIGAAEQESVFVWMCNFFLKPQTRTRINGKIKVGDKFFPLERVLVQLSIRL